MSEKLLPPGEFSPYETQDRYTDTADDSVYVTLEKQIERGKTLAYLNFQKDGTYSFGEIFLEFNNGTKLCYQIKKRSLYISAEDKVTDFGSVDYDRNGQPYMIHPAPFYRVDDIFWKESPSSYDRFVITHEIEAWEEAMIPLIVRFGRGDIPISELPDLETLCPTYCQLLGKLQALQRLEFINLKQIVRAVDKWEVIDRFDQKVAVGIWNQEFMFDEQFMTISEREGRLVVYQRSANGLRRKIFNVPLNVDYEQLNHLACNSRDWDRVFTVYPTTTFVEL